MNPSAMGTKFHISIDQQLGRAEARRRIESGVYRLADQLPRGASLSRQRWDGDRLVFEIAAMAQSVTGSVEVLDTSVTIDIELPGLLGRIAGAFSDRLRKAGQMLLTKD
jgi:putative polyhydroxyalkanoate system protein